MAQCHQAPMFMGHAYICLMLGRKLLLVLRGSHETEIESSFGLTWRSNVILKTKDVNSPVILRLQHVFDFALISLPVVDVCKFSAL